MISGYRISKGCAPRQGTMASQGPEAFGIVYGPEGLGVGGLGFRFEGLGRVGV